VDDDLRLLLHSPALTLDPPTGLTDVVRRNARRHRLRSRALSGTAAAALVVVGVLLAPTVRGSLDNLRTNADRAGALKPDARAPHATTEVVTMRTLNGAEVLTWFEGSNWCTTSTRHTRQVTCLGPTDPQHQGFSWIAPARSASVTVDDQHVVAGIVPPGATRVVVHMSDGREFEGDFVDGARFPVKVWSALLVDDAHATVQYYAAFNSTGMQIAQRPAS
jgi:hypothetical protein